MYIHDTKDKLWYTYVTECYTAMKSMVHDSTYHPQNGKNTEMGAILVVA